MQLGDARAGKFTDNFGAFGRALRRAGLVLDISRMALATQAMLAVGLNERADVSAALEATLVSREQDRLVFRELFDAFFCDPDLGQKLLTQMLANNQGLAESSKKRPRVREALLARPPLAQPAAPRPENKSIDFDAAMTAAPSERLRQADFNALSGFEYQLVERLAREIALELPKFATRRLTPGTQGSHLHGSRLGREAAASGGELLRLPRRQRQHQTLPLMVLIDVSGSMERYARLLLAFLHAATRHLRRRDFFAFGTRLTDLTPVLSIGDSDQMLQAANLAIKDFGSGTQLGACLTSLRQQHGRRLVGRRTLVLLISDGLDTGDSEQLVSELDWLYRHSKRLLWLNPLLRFDGYEPLARGAAALHQRAHAMLAIHNLEKLEDLASSLANLVRR
ncbi:MAG: VWA domain-containing protein [Burkholderiaceae bacterium]